MKFFPHLPHCLYLTLMGLFCLQPVHAAEVVCHVGYGGETRAIHAAPTDTPLAVPVQAIGSYFLFRAVFEAQVAIKVYVYADRDPDVPLPLHQSVYPWPMINVGRFGFTGQHFIYEPLRDGELEYWCEQR